MEDEEVDLYADQRGEPAYKPKEQQDEVSIWRFDSHARIADHLYSRFQETQ